MSLFNRKGINDINNCRQTHSTIKPVRSDEDEIRIFIKKNEKNKYNRLYPELYSFPKLTLLITFSLSAGLVMSQVRDGGSGFGGAYLPSKNWTPPKDSLALKKLHQFQDLKFGIMYNWGLQTVFGTIDQSWSLCPERYEWNKRPVPYENADWATYKKAYEDLQKVFNPVKFDPERDAKIIAVSGAKYILVDAKHHDGFCFFDTKTTDYKITSPVCPFASNKNANVVKVMLEAARINHLWAGIYFSKPDWNTPYYWDPQFGPATSRSENYSRKEHPDVWNKYQQLTAEQLKELTTDYGRVDILWLDGGQVSGSSINLPSIAASARERQPGLLVVDRVNGGGYEDYLTPEGMHAMPTHYLADAWEACMSLGNHGWAWNRTSTYQSSESVIHLLIKAVARNGNLVVGIGPDAAGELNTEVVAILKEIGSWLKINGEAIYDTRPIKPYELGDVFFTSKEDGTIYAIKILNKSDSVFKNTILVPLKLASKDCHVSLIGNKSYKLHYKLVADDMAEIKISGHTKLTDIPALVVKISK